MSDEAAERRSKLTEGTVTIVIAYVANSRVPHSELPALVALVGQSLIAAVTSPRTDTASAIYKPTKSEIEASITRDRLVSFIDGRTYQTLRRHLGRHGYTPASYRVAYGLPVDYPTVAPSYSERRTELSKQNVEKMRRLAVAGTLQ